MCEGYFLGVILFSIEEFFIEELHKEYIHRDLSKAKGNEQKIAESRTIRVRKLL